MKRNGIVIMSPCKYLHSFVQIDTLKLLPRFFISLKKGKTDHLSIESPVCIGLLGQNGTFFLGRYVGISGQYIGGGQLPPSEIQEKVTINGIKPRRGRLRRFLPPFVHYPPLRISDPLCPIRYAHQRYVKIIRHSINFTCAFLVSVFCRNFPFHLKLHKIVTVIHLHTYAKKYTENPLYRNSPQT